jgi:aminomethyltransferase
MRQTALNDEYASHGGKVIDFHGWALPVQFHLGIVQEHLHTRTKAALFDCSHMGEFRIRGTEAVEAYGGLVISDPAKVAVGRSRYGSILNEQGGIIDDVITFKIADDDLFVVTNAAPLEFVSKQIAACGDGAEDLSETTSKIDIQGPMSREVLAPIMPEAADLKYFKHTEFEWEGHPIILSRTGYTGELGYEIYLPNEAAAPLWRRLADHAAVEPAGLGARDTLRTEVGYALSGQDFDETRTPLEAQHDRFIAWDTEFIGKAALEAQRDAGGYDLLTPIQTNSRRAPRPGFEVQRDGETVGVVTSGTFGPSVGHGIGLAYLKPECAAPGTALTAGPRALPIETATLPFYADGTCRD